MARGVTGKYLIIDLTSRAHEEVVPDEAFYQSFLSGYGLGAAVITRRQPAGVDPLGPEAYFGLCSGMATGVGALFSGRFMAVGKSPLTQGWGDANAGGRLSRAIKKSGYDAVFFTGRADKPVWVLVTHEGIQIRDASHLWGTNAKETEAALRAETGLASLQTAVIGPAGEKKSLISGIVTDSGRLAARSGLGAVMGAKNLKAVAFYGKNRVQAARPREIKAINKQFLAEFQKRPVMDRILVRFMNFFSKIIARTGIMIPAQATTIREIYRQFGTPGLSFYSALTGDMPIQNWKGVGYTDFTSEKAARLSDVSVISRQKKKYHCQACPLGCGGLVELKNGEEDGGLGHKPEYETLAAFGGLMLQDDLDTVIEINEMCNQAGLDTISAGAAVAFAMECAENGLLKPGDLAGLDLRWGNARDVKKLVSMIIDRQGIGDVLADGVKKAAEKIGGGAEKFAMHAGGQELPMHDSRLDPGFAIAYQAEPTPGRHTISCFLYPGLFSVEKLYPAARQMVSKAGRGISKKVARYCAASFSTQLVNAGGFCLFGAMTSKLPVTEYLNAATGWDLSADEYLHCGERILNLRKAFTVREGIRPSHHRLPERALGFPPLGKGPLKGVRIDNDTLLNQVFDTLGWDPDTGGPGPEKMRELDIHHLF